MEESVSVVDELEIGDIQPFRISRTKIITCIKIGGVAIVAPPIIYASRIKELFFSR